MSEAVAAPAVAVVDGLIARAIELGASDLHLDPSQDGMDVRVRCDGVLSPLETLPAELAEHVVGRLKAIADLLVYRSDVPQEGRIPAGRAHQAADVRIATYPTLLGERVAVRFDSNVAAACTLAELGFDEGSLASLQQAVEQPDGVVLVTGPSGSGKTTTLYACLRHLVAGARSRTIVSVEDPVERRVDGVTQTEVNPVCGLDFARALRSLLRQDPEVLLVGEIRDQETAKIALEAGLTGHLVMSTVHAGTAPLVFARLLEMGIEPFVLTTAVRGVLAQRLLRRVCSETDCAGGGATCPRCGGSGYHGRIPIAEWLPMTAELRKTVLARGDGESLAEAALDAGQHTLREAGERAVGAGLTTPQEIERVLGVL